VLLNVIVLPRSDETTNPDITSNEMLLDDDVSPNKKQIKKQNKNNI
jgi:hypothetical protein